jgi:hypothetical protein
MRKIIAILMFVATAALSGYSQHVVIGLQGGLNLNNFGLTVDSFPITHSLFGYQAGIYTRLHIQKYFVQTEVSYMNQRNNVVVSDKSANSVVSNDISANFIMAGFVAGYRIGILRLAGGLYLSKQFSQQFELNNNQDFMLSPYFQSSFRAGIQGGVGLKIAQKWNIDLRAMMALDKTQYQVSLNHSDYLFNGLSKNLTVTLGYNIFSF